MKTSAALCALLCILTLTPLANAKSATARVAQKHDAPITALAYAPDGKTLASASENGRVKLTDIASNKTKLTFRYREQVAALAYSPDGKILAVARGKEVRLLNPQTAAPIRVLKTQAEVGDALGFSANGNRLIISEGDGNDGAMCSVWDVNRGKQLQRHSVKYADVQTAALSPDGKMFAAPNPEREKFGLSLWNVETGRRIRLLINENTEQDYPYIGTVAFSPDGKSLAGTGSYMEGPGHLTMWNVATGKPRWGRTFSDFGGALAWSPDSSRIAVGTSYDTTYDDPKDLHQPTGAPIFGAKKRPVETFIAARAGRHQRALFRAQRQSVGNRRQQQNRPFMALKAPDWNIFTASSAGPGLKASVVRNLLNSAKRKRAAPMAPSARSVIT